MTQSFLASLPMYDLQYVRQATLGWWRGVRNHLKALGLQGVPDQLDSPDNLYEHWRTPDLLLSQTCGYPLIQSLRDEVQIVGTPVYDAAGCDAYCYRSAILVHARSDFTDLTQLREKIVAYNGQDSHSGYNALRHYIAPHAQNGVFFSGSFETGGHIASVAAVADKQADVCAVDCVTFALLNKHAPELTRDVRILGWSEPAPGLPLITGKQWSEDFVSMLKKALRNAVSDPLLCQYRDSLLIKDIAFVDESEYDTVLVFEKYAIAKGYPKLQ